MRCGYLALLLVAVFVTAQEIPVEHTAGHLVVEVKGGTPCASYCVEYGRCQDSPHLCCKEWGRGSQPFPHHQNRQGTVDGR
jgi:hypothetical protein